MSASRDVIEIVVRDSDAVAFRKVLVEVVRLLRRSRTARDIAAKTGCSVPAAHRRIDIVRERLDGERYKLVRKRCAWVAGKTGPRAFTYWLETR